MLHSLEHELPALSLGIPALSCLKTRPMSCQSQRSTSYDSGPAQFAETTHYHRRTTSDLSQAEVSDMDFHFSVPRSTGSRQFSSPNGSAMIRPLPLHPHSLSRSSSAISEPPAEPDTYSTKKRLRRNTNGWAAVNKAACVLICVCSSGTAYRAARTHGLRQCCHQQQQAG